MEIMRSCLILRHDLESLQRVFHSVKIIAQAQAVITLFEDLGTAPVIDEKLMDAATVLAASGTAFALRYIRASMQAGIEIGFDWKTALAISAQTVKGRQKC
jgi:pyrroline-5-carboxylate reductase